MRYVVTITPASAVVQLGMRVEVWSLQSANGRNSTPAELAVGARVMGLYTAQGQPVQGTTSAGGLLTPSTTPSTPALAALAVPSDAVPEIIAEDPGQTVLLIQDPTMSRFALVTAAPSTAPTGTSSTTKAPTKPS